MISIVLPCFNEESILEEVYERFTSASARFGEPYEIVVVNDGSSDRSKAILEGFHSRNPRWKVLSFSRNFGHQAAISCGLRYASGDGVIVMDIDLQDPPECLPILIAKWREGFDVVYAVRKKRKENIFKRAAYQAFYRILDKIAEIDMPLDSGDFCLMDRRVVDHLNALPEYNRFIRGLRAWLGFKQVGVEYERHARFGGDPKYTLAKLMGLALAGIFAFSKVPLRIITFLGLTISLSSFAGMIFFVMHRLLDFKLMGYSPKDVPGTATIVVSILFIGGIQLLCLSVIGEYLGRMYDEVKRRPIWVLESMVGVGPSRIERELEKVA